MGRIGAPNTQAKHRQHCCCFVSSSHSLLECHLHVLLCDQASPSSQSGVALGLRHQQQATPSSAQFLQRP